MATWHGGDLQQPGRGALRLERLQVTMPVLLGVEDVMVTPHVTLPVLLGVKGLMMALVRDLLMQTWGIMGAVAAMGKMGCPHLRWDLAQNLFRPHLCINSRPGQV